MYQPGQLTSSTFSPSLLSSNSFWFFLPTYANDDDGLWLYWLYWLPENKTNPFPLYRFEKGEKYYWFDYIYSIGSKCWGAQHLTFPADWIEEENNRIGPGSASCVIYSTQLTEESTRYGMWMLRAVVDDEKRPWCFCHHPKVKCLDCWAACSNDLFPTLGLVLISIRHDAGEVSNTFEQISRTLLG